MEENATLPSAAPLSSVPDDTSVAKGADMITISIPDVPDSFSNWKVFSVVESVNVLMIFMWLVYGLLSPEAIRLLVLYRDCIAPNFWLADASPDYIIERLDILFDCYTYIYVE